MPALDSESWLTPQRLERMTKALRAVHRAGRTGLRLELADRTIWKTVGGPLSDVPDILQILRALGLLRHNPPHLELTRPGRQVATQDHQQGGRLLARQIISRGLLLNQSRVLIESSEADGTGALHCRRDLAVSLAPQLTGLLRRFPAVQFGPHLVIPHALVAELDSAWIPAATRTRVDNRKSLGDRGEEFSYKYERDNAADRTRIHWVAQDDDNLGYDIEDSTESSPRLIEVKASAAAEVRFFLSTNEWRVASENPTSYEVQFWGGVNLAAEPAEEYKRLRASGYPILFSNLSAHVESGRLLLEASQYVVTEGPAEPPQAEHS
jgi:hypothetical protein